MSQYIPADRLDEAREAHRQGIPLSVLAGKLNCDESHLATLLGLPQWKAIPAVDDDSCDLWAADRLDGVL